MSYENEQARHTPGPWWSDDLSGIIYAGSKETPIAIAVVFDDPDSGLGPMDREQSDYNRCLLETSPELLEECENDADWFTSLLNDIKDGGILHPDAIREGIEIRKAALSAAIAKAKGGGL